jgi:ankyrin repeat protein
VAWLLAHGSDPNASDARGFTSLHRAAEMGHAESVRLLLEHGARRDCEARGYTPVSLARSRGHPEIVSALGG